MSRDFEVTIKRTTEETLTFIVQAASESIAQDIADQICMTFSVGSNDDIKRTLIKHFDSARNVASLDWELENELHEIEAINEIEEDDDARD